jgi:multidrug efflux pump subunit AcrA (membrane-fusion protein)
MSRLLNNKWLKFILFGCLVVVIAETGITKHWFKNDNSDQFKIGKVERGDVIQRVTIAGTVTPDHKTLISAPYSAYVNKLYVQVGDHVKTGDPIVSLTQSLNGVHEDVHPMRAPFEGLVVQVLRVEGEYIDLTNTGSTNGTGIVMIEDLRQLHIDASAPELDVQKLKVGQDVIIKASSILTRSYQGKIKNIALAAKEQQNWDKSRVEFSVLMDVLDADPQLEPGMSVICDIIAKKVTGVLFLADEFIQKDKDKYTVTDENGQTKAIEVGIQNEEAFEIKSGVTEGEKVRETDFLSLALSAGKSH